MIACADKAHPPKFQLARNLHASLIVCETKEKQEADKSVQVNILDAIKSP